MSIPVGRSAVEVEWLRGLHAEYNRLLREWATGHPYVTYLQHPARSQWSRSSTLWDADCLHMSVKGYDQLAQDVAPVVSQAARLPFPEPPGPGTGAVVATSVG